MKAREVASEIRQYLNTALRDGSIDAREYAKQIQQIDEQLRKLSERRKGFFNGGIVGIAERKTEEGNAKISMGATSVAAGEEKIREGRIKGDIGLVAEGLKLKVTGRPYQNRQEAGRRRHDAEEALREHRQRPGRDSQYRQRHKRRLQPSQGHGRRPRHRHRE